MGAGQGRMQDLNRFSGTGLLLRDASDASVSTACSLDLSTSVAASSLGLPELSEPLGIDEETHLVRRDRLRNRSPLPHHLPPPPPPPPTGGVGHDLQHFRGNNFSSLHAHLHGQTTLLNRSSSPAHDLGYHTLQHNSLTARSPTVPWSPADLADLTLTPSPRAEYFSARRTTPSPFTPQWAPRKSPRAQPPHIPNQTDGSFQLASKSIKMNSATTEDLLTTTGKGKKKSAVHKQQHGYKSPQFAELTDDVVLLIFSFLSSSQLALCGCVCLRWHVLAWDPQLWSTIVLSGDSLVADRALKCITRVLGRASPPFCPTVERIIMSSCVKLTDRGLQTISRRCPELRRIELRGCIQLTDNGILELVSKCIHLSHLDVSGCSQITCIDAELSKSNSCGGEEIYSSEISSNPRPQLYLQLQYLDLTDCINLNDSGIEMIVRSCSQLTCLYLRRCIHVTDVGVKYLATYCTALKELSISDCLQVTDFGMYEAARLGPNLRYLSVAKCDQISDAGIKQIGRHCYKLRYLNLRGCEAVSDDSLEVLARSCSRLRALDLGKCDITDRGLRLLAEHCPNLKKLSVKSCELVTDEGVRSIAYYCRGLRQLNIQDSLITVEGYRAVKKFCRKCIIEHTNPGFF